MKKNLEVFAAGELKDLGDMGGNRSRADAELCDRERAAREKAVRFACASLGLEGFSLSPASEQYAAQFVAGLIDLDEFVRRGKIGV